MRREQPDAERAHQDRRHRGQHRLVQQVFRPERKLRHRNSEEPDVGVGRAEPHDRPERGPLPEHAHHRPAERDEDHELHDRQRRHQPDHVERLLAGRQEVHQERRHHDVDLQPRQRADVEPQPRLQRPADRRQRDDRQRHARQDVDEQVHAAPDSRCGRIGNAGVVSGGAAVAVRLLCTCPLPQAILPTAAKLPRSRSDTAPRPWTELTPRGGDRCRGYLRSR